MDNFQVPLIQKDVSTLSPKKANEEAFYAAATKGGSDIISNYESSRMDLEQKGQSDFIDTEKNAWVKEKEQTDKETINNLMGDTTVSKDIKRAILQGYSLTGDVSTTLKDKYIQKTAIKPNHQTIDDMESQDTNVELLGERVLNNKIESQKSNILSGTFELTKILSSVMSRNTLGMDRESTSKATTSIASSIVASIPAGIAGLFQAVKEQDSTKGTELIQEIQSYAYSPSDKRAQQIQEVILRASEVVGIPAKTIGDFVNVQGNKVLPIEGAAGLATVAEIGLDPINWIPFFKAGKGVKPLPETILHTPKVPLDSPLEVTNVANPKSAETAAITAIEEPTGKLAAALGVDKGDIIHDWVLPKVVSEEVATVHPDLASKLVAKIQAEDDAVRASFIQSRYDPNIINATTREAEVDNILKITRESRAPYYNQSMSLINETDKLFEGNAVFGRDNISGYTRVKDAREAYTNLKESIDQLPEEQRGQLALVKHGKQYYMNWQWKKEYNEIDQLVFSKDSIQTSILGMDVSAIARSSTGRWLFPTGRFPTWLENSSLRGVERGAKIKEDLTKNIRNNIANSKHKAELDYIINDAEAKGIDYYSPEKIGSMFPKLSKKEVEDLFVTHTFWNRQQQYNHNFMNREVRNNLVRDNMQGLYAKDGTYLGHASEKVSPKELESIKEVWDFDKQAAVPYNAEVLTQTGRKVVRLAEKIRGEGSLHYYGLTGVNARINLLPQEVLQRIPGYSGRKVKESWYVDTMPKNLSVNGILEKDPNGLRQYAETKAAAKTEHEANKIAEQLTADNPNHVISVRPERVDNFGRVMTDYAIHQEFLKHSMKRGERLPSLNGPARLEDRMVTLLNTTSALSRMGSTRAWTDAFQSAFTKGFSKFTKGEFPQYATDIKPLENMDRALQQEYKTAHALFKHYERIKNTETAGDFYYSAGLHVLADVLEKWKIPSEFLRGKKQNPLMAAKTVATVSYIHMAPLRQWLIQPAQQLEMYAINPASAAKNFSNTMAIRMYMGADSKMLQDYKSIIQGNAKKSGEMAGNKEFLEDVEAIRNSGVLQSVDMNSIVHGVFRETDRHLVENVPEKIWKDIETATKVIPRMSRAIGFDAAELTNRIGNWLQVKDLWKEKNPGRDWKTKEAQEEIAVESLKLSGAMNRAGQLPYQEGMLSVGFQFAAINHKMLMNLIQDNTTILNGAQRARLAAVRFALFGGKYGIPGGAAAYYFIDKSEDPIVKDNAELIKRGLIDYSANRLMAALVEPDEKPDLAVSKILSPYSDGFLPYFSVGWETLKLVDSKPAGPKYPAFGMISSFGDAIDQIKGWWVTKEVNDSNFGQMAIEAAELASGFNSYSQGLLMLGMRDKITKSGNKYGMEFTASEAYAKMTLGIGTQKEEDLWKIVELEGDTRKQKHEMAKMIYSQMLNQRNKADETDYETKVRKLNSFINLLDPNHFSAADKLDVITEIEKLDEKNYKTIKQSILVEHWKYHQEKRTEEWRQVDELLKRSPDPETQKYLEAINKGKL